MKPVLLIVFLCLIGSVSNAQDTAVVKFPNLDTVVEYYDAGWKKVDPTKVPHAYFRIAIKTNEGIWKVKDYYAGINRVQMSGIFTDDSLTQKDGRFHWYYENGVLEKSVFFFNNKIVGLYKGYDRTGRLNDTMRYNENGMPIGQSTVWDEEGNILSRGEFSDAGTGSGYIRNYYSNGSLRSVGKFSNGFKSDSTWTYYYEDGTIFALEEYKHGEWLSYDCFTKDGKPKTDKCDTLTMPEASYNVYEFLAREIIFPADVKEYAPSGSYLVEIRFVVDENGYIQDPFVVTKSYESLNKEGLRVISKMPQWIPGKSRNKPVKVYYTLPVRFTLDKNGRW